MKNADHNVGINKASLVVRKLKLNFVNENKTTLLTALGQIAAVDKVLFNQQRQTLTVSYDASRCDLNVIETLLAKYNIVITDDWWMRVKKSYYQFSDQNIKDNASHQATCCHKPPPNFNNKK
jgi:hypothetical protein